MNYLDNHLCGNTEVIFLQTGWWCRSVIPELGRLRQGSLSHRVQTVEEQQPEVSVPRSHSSKPGMEGPTCYPPWSGTDRLISA